MLKLILLKLKIKMHIFLYLMFKLLLWDVFTSIGVNSVFKWYINTG